MVGFFIRTRDGIQRDEALCGVGDVYKREFESWAQGEFGGGGILGLLKVFGLKVTPLPCY